ncbi:vWA domain-containing protein [Chengkuizengella marina]|uniref:Peptidase n=1 Tax=Chengkuizengella marina TaxID=2507566 RepID=A0A6N9Q1I4_9BACL|nr:peptidase [Chengkuizengella marina]NBI27458.1 peptidase [Chengkuizengella marina]
MSKDKKQKVDIASVHFLKANLYIENHPMFSPLVTHANIFREENTPYPPNGWAVVSKKGNIYTNPNKKGGIDEWIYILAHCLLHLGFGHFKEKENKQYWNIACDVYIAKFLLDMKLGKPPWALGYQIQTPVKNEDKLYDSFIENGVPEEFIYLGTAGENQIDMLFKDHMYTYRWGGEIDWQACFGKGLSIAVTSAIQVAGGYQDTLSEGSGKYSIPEKAKKWFVNHYPLLGSLASNFKIIDDVTLCQRLDISIAAIDVLEKEIYINPAAGLDEEECKFVLAHEFLHAGLMHQQRCLGRDHYFWNVACDYVINHWLVEMGIGEIPKVGILLDQNMKGLSAESIYDRIVSDIRTYKKIYTLRGIGQGDIIEKGNRSFWDPRNGITIDDFCKNSLQQGFVYHQEMNRGLLPAGLVEEIKALGQPPIKWDVELAKWFDQHFSPQEKIRTYARISRRQSSTPDIPRPKWVSNGGDEDGRTFGVILDTSGSMDKKLLSKALGAISSYSLSRDVPFARVVFCDAMAYDAGYLSPEEIAGRVQVKGRGGTILQPAIDLLQETDDFPKKGPILIITDGYIHRLKITREHAYIIPKGNSLPFVPKGPVFRIE